MIVAVFNEDIPQMLARGYRDFGPSKSPTYRLMAWVDFDTGPILDMERARLTQAVAALEGTT